VVAVLPEQAKGRRGCHRDVCAAAARTPAAPRDHGL
jgi:hypothetical protein